MTQSPTQRSRSAEKWGQAVWPRCYLGYFPEPVSPGKGSDPLNLGVFGPELCPRLEEQGRCCLFRPHSLFRDCAQGAEPEAHVGLASRVGAGAAARLRLSAEGAARCLFIPCTMAPRMPDPSRTLPHPGTKRGHPSPAGPWSRPFRVSFLGPAAQAQRPVADRPTASLFRGSSLFPFAEYCFPRQTDICLRANKLCFSHHFISFFSFFWYCHCLCL